MKTLEWYAQQAGKLSEIEVDINRKNDLTEMERICRKLVTEKPETFREAIQLVIIYTMIDGAREWGRMDDYLALYYKNDLENGIMNEEEAIRLLTSFWQLMIAKEQVTDDRVIIGGLGRKHPKEADELAMVIMEVSRRVKDIVPQLTLRMYKGMNPKLYEKALDCIGEGCTYPMLYQDENIIPGVIYILNPEVSFEEGALCEPLGCCLHGIDKANIRTGDTVLIIGGGTIGSIMIQLAKLAGASTVILSEPVEEKWILAKKMGADHTINPLKQTPFEFIQEKGIREINVTIECVVSKATMLDAFKYISNGGHVLLFGVSDPDLEIPVKLYEIFQREITVTASYVNPYTHGRAANLLNTRKLQLSELISDKLTLDEIEDAFKIREKKGKAMIYPNI